MASSPQHEWYFFERLNNPHWIGPLKERGFFAHPPKGKVADVGRILYPNWSPSRYLARMAKQAPSEVASIFAEIDTDNFWVLRDLLHAALAMPSDIAATLVPTVCKSVTAGLLHGDMDDASGLCAKLAAEGQADAALMLAGRLFAVPLGERGDEGKEYWYKDGLKKVLPDLVAVRPVDFCGLSCGWLRSAVVARGYNTASSDEDYSYSWRPAIEEHEQNNDFDLASPLVGFVRQAFESAVAAKGIAFDAALALLDAHFYLIFKRLRIHLINVFAEQQHSLAIATMMNQALIVDYRLKHEYAMLIGQRWPMLSPGQQEQWLQWVEAARSEDEIESSAEEETEQARMRWRRYERFHWIRDHLSGERLRFYQEMREKHGEPSLADMLVRSTIRWGYESPLSLDDLKGMNFESAVEKVVSWRPAKPKDFGSSIEGLAETFGKYVAVSPEEYSNHGRLLIDRHPIFVRKFIEQMKAAAKTGHSIDLPTVLSLCDWVVSQPLNQIAKSAEESGGFVDKNWQWTRDEISGFIQHVCEANVNGKPKYSADSRVRRQSGRSLNAWLKIRRNQISCTKVRVKIRAHMTISLWASIPLVARRLGQP